MSLKFGIYLVEQRIISPEQFCGLVKIQQEASASIATIALRKNILTIKQVANVLDIAEVQPDKSFIKIATELDLIDRSDAEQLLHEQQLLCPTMRKLVVECGLLTQRQTSVLYLHFERNGSKPVSSSTQSKPAAQPAADPIPVGSSQSPRQPKFRQRPVIVRQYTQG
jgi:hypothetical protein